jgi:hypothetical protein
MEQCERISLRNVCTIAESLAAACLRLQACRKQRAAPFQYWINSHSFSAQPLGSLLGGGRLRGSELSLPSSLGEGEAGKSSVLFDGLSAPEADAATVSDTSGPSQVFASGAPLWVAICGE